MDSRGGMTVPREVYVFPRDSNSLAWILREYREVDRLFRAGHTFGKPGLREYHPHGVLLEKAIPEAKDADEPEAHLYIGAHWDRTHEERTKADVRRVFETLGADLARFVIQGTSDSESES